MIFYTPARFIYTMIVGPQIERFKTFRNFTKDGLNIVGYLAKECAVHFASYLIGSVGIDVRLFYVPQQVNFTGKDIIMH